MLGHAKPNNSAKAWRYRRDLTTSGRATRMEFHLEPFQTFLRINRRPLAKEPQDGSEVGEVSSKPGQPR